MCKQTLTTITTTNDAFQRPSIDISDMSMLVGLINIVYISHYIIHNNGILKSNSSVFPQSEGYILQYTP